MSEHLGPNAPEPGINAEGLPLRCSRDFCGEQASWIGRESDTAPWSLVCDKHSEKYKSSTEARHVKSISIITDRTVQAGHLMTWGVS